MITGIVVGVVVLLLCIIPCIMGIVRQNKSKAFDPVLYGEMPIAAIVFHSLFTLFIVLGLVLMGFAAFFDVLLYISAAIYMFKLCAICCCNRESGAF